MHSTSLVASAVVAFALLVAASAATAQSAKCLQLCSTLAKAQVAGRLLTDDEKALVRSCPSIVESELAARSTPALGFNPGFSASKAPTQNLTRAQGSDQNALKQCVDERSSQGLVK